MKVETHNHPTAISPFSGAATGSGGEIRDEGATGRGSATKAGLTGFSVSHLKIPNFAQPWEQDNGKPERIASALDIMLAGPLGGAAFNNEFGRPNLAGYFRSFEQPVIGTDNAFRGYHKPIMLAGGMGNIRPMLVEKQKIPAGSLIIILGGPAMLIGLGGGAASSQASGASSESLDFASVQRENPEMQRRRLFLFMTSVRVVYPTPCLKLFMIVIKADASNYAKSIMTTSECHRCKFGVMKRKSVMWLPLSLRHYRYLLSFVSANIACLQ
jgi:phosphoribosylformylglycinamidine synthase